MSDAVRDPLIGARLGGYEVRSWLGRGGFADVYCAVQVQLHRDVALKVLREPETGLSPERVAAFLREARAAAAFSHPNLVHVHDVGEAGGRHYLSMELVRGGNLAARIRASGPIAWREAVALTIDIGEALACAHAHGMLHGDVKPANILLTGGGRAKLADLGLATAAENAGTKAFMAPERILRREVDARSDLYSLGCTLYAMLTGAVPFPHARSKAMLIAHVKEKPQPVHASGVIVPDALEALVADLLAKDPRRRPRDAQELLARLRRLDTAADRAADTAPRRERAAPATRPIAPESDAPETTPSRRRTRRRRAGQRVPWGTIAGIATLLGMAVLAVWAWRRFGG